MHLTLPILMSTQALDKDVFCYAVMPSEEKHIGTLLKPAMLEVMSAQDNSDVPQSSNSHFQVSIQDIGSKSNGSLEEASPCHCVNV